MQGRIHRVVNLARGWGAKGSGLTMGNYLLTASAGANDDATMDKGNDDVDGNNGPYNDVGGHVCW